MLLITIPVVRLLIIMIVVTKMLVKIPMIKISVSIYSSFITTIHNRILSNKSNLTVLIEKILASISLKLIVFSIVLLIIYSIPYFLSSLQFYNYII